LIKVNFVKQGMSKAGKEAKQLNRLSSVLVSGPGLQTTSSQGSSPEYRYRSYMDIPEEEREQEFAQKYSPPYPGKSFSWPPSLTASKAKVSTTIMILCFAILPKIR
jgi:hypothetical protein